MLVWFVRDDGGFLLLCFVAVMALVTGGGFGLVAITVFCGGL